MREFASNACHNARILVHKELVPVKMASTSSLHPQALAAILVLLNVQLVLLKTFA
jgi:hypothetical protein